MKLAIITTIFFLTTLSARADYTALKIYQMVFLADKIVYGEISEMDSATFTINVHQNLTGKEKSLTVQKFKNWPCAWRWTDYQIGQKVLLFLREYKGKLRAMSAGNEGELPVINDSIYIHRLSLNPQPPFWPESIQPSDTADQNILVSQRHSVNDKYFHGHRTRFQEFISTVSTLRKCVEAEFNKTYDLTSMTLKCTEEEINQSQQTTAFSKWIYEELKRKTGGNNK
jgi:hypothetical protein